jgi:hypothetical protein
VKTKLTQRRIKARKASACGLCKPWKQGWMKTARDIRHAQRAQQQFREVGFRQCTAALPPKPLPLAKA